MAANRQAAQGLKVVVDDREDGLIGEERSEPEGVVVEIDDQVWAGLIEGCKPFAEIAASHGSVEAMQPGEKPELVMQRFSGRQKAHPLNTGFISRTGIGWGEQTGRFLNEGDRVACISQEPGELMTEARRFAPIGASDNKNSALKINHRQALKREREYPSRHAHSYTESDRRGHSPCRSSAEPSSSR